MKAKTKKIQGSNRSKERKIELISKKVCKKIKEKEFDTRN